MYLLENLLKEQKFRAKRVSSWDKTGRNRDAITIEPQSAVTLAEINKPGMISHIWFTISCEDKDYLRKLLFRAYWDGEKNPSIDSPVGDFFGVGHGCVTSYQCFPFNMSTNKAGYGGNAAMNCFFPMPFQKKAKLEIVNDCEVPVRSFYYYIDYQETPTPPDYLYFHAKWRRENPCPGWKGKGSVWQSKGWRKRMEGKEGVNLTGEDNYLFLHAEGKGHYVGCNLSIDNLYKGWWGEGDDMIFVDGEKWPPSLHGTGSEDYFAHAWGMQDNAFLFNGLSYHSEEEDFNNRGKVTVYRYHILDPVPFQKSLQVSIEHGHANNRSDDYSSVAYWYQSEPHLDFASMLPVNERLPNS